MLRYIFSTLLLVIAFSAFSQNKKEELPQREIFIRPGIDLSRFALPIFHDIGITGFEFSMDGEINYNLFPTFEIGLNSIKENTEDFDYEANGNYWRIGINYNMLKYQHRLDRNMFFIGARYGMSNFTQQATNITFENDWGQSVTDFPETDIQLQWVEGVIGIKGEIFKNFFMGYTIRVKGKIKMDDDLGITPYFIPGYGDGSKDLTTGMSFSASYALPIIRIKN